MTLDEAVLTLYETLGEPTDFRPTGADWVTLDPTSTGYQRLANLLNSGQTACANFKTRRGSQIRFGNLVANTNVTIKEISAPFDIDGLDPYKMYINKSDLPNPAIPELSTSGRFENSFFTIYDETYDVDWDNYDDVTGRWEIYLTEPVPTDPTDRTVYITKNSFYFLPPSHPWVGENFREPTTISYGTPKGNLTYVLKINNLTDQEEVRRANMNEDFLQTYNENDTPTEFVLFGKEIRFNTIPPTGTRFNVEYYRTPTRLSDGGENFEIPEQFHYGIIMWATWQGLIRLHELETAILFKRDWFDFMNITKNDNDYKWERTIEGSGTIRRR